MKVHNSECAKCMGIERKIEEGWFIFRIAESHHSNGRTSLESLNGRVRSFPMAKQTMSARRKVPYLVSAATLRQIAPRITPKSSAGFTVQRACCNLCRVEMPSTVVLSNSSSHPVSLFRTRVRARAQLKCSPALLVRPILHGADLRSRYRLTTAISFGH